MRPAHTLIVFSGQIEYGSNVLEQWSFGIRCELDVTASLSGMADTASGARAAYVTHIKPQMDASVALTKTVAAQVTGAGLWDRDDDGAFVKGEYLGHDNGTRDGGAQLPLQSATVVTLLSARAGSSGKGRVFLPCPKESLDETGRLTTARATAYRDGVKGLVNALNALSGPGPVAVVSTKGFTSAVTGVRCGRVVDTLRSRRRSQPEEYLTVAL